MLIKSYIILGDIYTTKENLFMFQVFVDSAANLPAVTAKKYDIHVVSFVNLVNGKELVCFDPDLSPEEELSKGKEYYNAMRTGCEIKTGLISTANFADAFRTALEADQDVIYLSLSKNISGTYNSARLAAEELLEEYGGKRKIRLVDSLNASLAQGILAIYASEMRDRGMNVDEAADLLETYVSKMNGVFTVGDLKYLSRTGRIKGSVAVVGNMLKIKPILRGSEDGYIVSTYYPYSTNYGKYIAETGGIFHMKATGIVRRIDDLGRVVVPKEIRRTMRIREGQAMEIYTGREGEIILKKYSPIEELAECAAGFTKSISTVTGCLVCVSDQEQIVAANGPEQKNYLGKSISSRLEEAILNRKTVLARPGEKAYFSILENTDNTTPLPELIFPILSSGDAIGSVILCGKDRESLPGDTEKKLLQVAATYLGREMEN